MKINSHRSKLIEYNFHIVSISILIQQNFPLNNPIRSLFDREIQFITREIAFPSLLPSEESPKETNTPSLLELLQFLFVLTSHSN